MNNGAGLDFSADKEDGLWSRKLMVKNDQNLGPDKARENAETRRLVTFIKTYLCIENMFQYL